MDPQPSVPEPSGPGPSVRKHSTEGYRPMADGIVATRLVHGQRTLMMRFQLARGSRIPSHSHVHEQIGYLVDGRMRFTIGDEVSTVESGDSWCIPGGVEHGVETLEDSVVIEVFSPPRDDYLD